MSRRQSGQIFPLMAGILLVVLALGFLLFQVARAGVLRSEAQTGADAAALAGVRNAKQQLDAMSAAGGVASVALIQDALVLAAAQTYAAKNGTTIVDYRRIGVDVKVRVKTNDDLGDDAGTKHPEELDREDVKGAARARARIELTSAFGGLGSLPGGGSGAPTGGDGNVEDDDWARFKKEELQNKPPTCEDASSSNDVIKLGEFLQSQGFTVSENAAFGGASRLPGERKATSWHFRCNGAGAIDVNFGAGGAEKAKIDPLIDKLHDLGFSTIWQYDNHYDHLHVDTGGVTLGAGAATAPGATGSGGAGGGLGGFGFGDQAMEIRLIDWDAAYTDFNPYPADGTATPTAGNPDPEVMRIMCTVLDSRNASARVRLATFETAIVESGVRNLTYGDRTSVGVFQQQTWWGTYDQRTNVAYATNKFLNGNGPPGALELDKRWSGSTGALAQEVQVSAFPDKYDQVAGQAASLHNKYCGGEQISPNS